MGKIIQLSSSCLLFSLSPWLQEKTTLTSKTENFGDLMPQKGWGLNIILLTALHSSLVLIKSDLKTKNNSSSGKLKEIVTDEAESIFILCYFISSTLGPAVKVRTELMTVTEGRYNMMWKLYNSSTQQTACAKNNIKSKVCLHRGPHMYTRTRHPGTKEKSSLKVLWTTTELLWWQYEHHGTQTEPDFALYAS